MMCHDSHIGFQLRTQKIIFVVDHPYIAPAEILLSYRLHRIFDLTAIQFVLLDWACVKKDATHNNIFSFFEWRKTYKYPTEFLNWRLRFRLLTHNLNWIPLAFISIKDFFYLWNTIHHIYYQYGYTTNIDAKW
jgi:hypothetical protein